MCSLHEASAAYTPLKSRFEPKGNFGKLANRRGEIVTICKRALAKNGPMTTRELAVSVIREKGLDENDTVLRTSIAYRIVQAMRLQWKRGKVDSPEKKGNVRVWSLSR